MNGPAPEESPIFFVAPKQARKWTQHANKIQQEMAGSQAEKIWEQNPEIIEYLAPNLKDANQFRFREKIEKVPAFFEGAKNGVFFR